MLRNDFKCIFDSKALKKLTQEKPDDIVILSGAFDLGKVLKSITKTSIRVHIDIANSISSITTITKLAYKFQTIFLSTSSDIFKQEYSGSIDKLKNDLLTHYCENFLFKENRGGSRFFMSTSPDTPLSIGTQIRKVVHSVGLGDCFDVVYAHLSNLFDAETSLNYASWIAAEYSVTTHYEQFKKGCERVLGMTPDLVKNIRGLIIPWENRASYNIYIAAPDFDYIDTTPIDYLNDALEYHNFKPRRPVKENGQMRPETTSYEKQMLCEKDLLILEECRLLIAVMINNDPGTLIEIGFAVAQKKPVIVYDLFNTSKNLMLTQLPNLVVNSLDEVIKGVFELSSGD